MIQPLTPMTDDEINSLARDVITNKVFVTLSDSDIIAFESFLMLAGSAYAADGEHEQWVAYLEDVGAVYEYLDKAGPRSINGYPMFLSANFLHKDSVNPLRRKVIEMGVAIGQFPAEALTQFDEARHG